MSPSTPTIDQSYQHVSKISITASRLMKYTSGFLGNCKYLLFQEKCRICKRFIHPELKGMDYKLYRPPGSIIFKEKEVWCDSLCRFCWRLISSEQPAASTYQLVLGSGEVDYLSVISAVSFQGETKKLIYQFKYDGDLLIARDLAMLALVAWQRIARVVDPESACIVAVPLHASRLKERGFNQSELIAKHLGKFAKIERSTRALVRIKKTASQQQLGKLQRWNNVRGAFQANSTLIKDKQIILVDDVLTSGATILECARTLKEAGTASIIALTIAKVEL